jgi:hypothetical protein
VGCNGYGDTREKAIADLREAVLMVLEDDGVPETLSVVLDDVPRCHQSPPVRGVRPAARRSRPLRTTSTTRRRTVA